MPLLKPPLRQALLLIFVSSGLILQSAFGVEQAHTRLTVAAAKSVDALWALQLDDGEDNAAAAYLTSAAEGEQTTSTFLDQDGQNHPLFRAEDDDTWRPDRYAREALAYSESHDDLLGRTLREKTTRSVWQGVRDKTSETGGALGEQIISDPWGTVKTVGGAIKDDTWEMVRHPIRTAGNIGEGVWNIGEGVWTLGKDAAYNLGNSAKSTWAGSFGEENALNTLYGQNMGAPLLGMSAIQATLTAAQVVPVAKGAQALGKGVQALGKGALRAGKTAGEKGLFQLGRGEGIKNVEKTVGFTEEGNTIFIGKLQDLKDVQPDKTLLPELPNLGSAKANFKQNSSVLRRKVREGKKIQDKSFFRKNSDIDPSNPSKTVGQSFLGAERLILDSKGLIPDEKGVFRPK